LHPLYEFGLLGHDPEGLPVLQLLEFRVDLLQLARIPLGQGRGLWKHFRNGLAQPGGTCRPAVL
jgi:hypothetical protein